MPFSWLRIRWHPWTVRSVVQRAAIPLHQNGGRHLCPHRPQRSQHCFSRSWRGRSERCHCRYRPYRGLPSARTEPRSRWPDWISAWARRLRPRLFWRGRQADGRGRGSALAATVSCKHRLPAFSCGGHRVYARPIGSPYVHVSFKGSPKVAPDPQNAPLAFYRPLRGISGFALGSWVWTTD